MNHTDLLTEIDREFDLFYSRISKKVPMFYMRNGSTLKKLLHVAYLRGGSDIQGIRERLLSSLNAEG